MIWQWLGMTYVICWHANIANMSLHMSKEGFYASCEYHRLAYSSGCTQHMHLMCRNMWELCLLLYQLYNWDSGRGASPRLDGFQRKCHPSCGGCCSQLLSHKSTETSSWRWMSAGLGWSNKCKQVTSNTYIYIYIYNYIYIHGANIKITKIGNLWDFSTRNY